jgi:hypothetical protein
MGPYSLTKFRPKKKPPPGSGAANSEPGRSVYFGTGAGDALAVFVFPHLSVTVNEACAGPLHTGPSEPQLNVMAPGFCKADVPADVPSGFVKTQAYVKGWVPLVDVLAVKLA